MDCSLTQSTLIGYHFATVSDDDRASVEAHLLTCRACLGTYLALKAHVDRGAREREVPSEAARLRLRSAVEARFARAPRRAWVWLVRPIPLYQGLAVAALVLLAATLGPAVARSVHPGPVARDAERVDTARHIAVSLSIY
jgi:anti-sigma factor RsiW